MTEIISERQVVVEFDFREAIAFDVQIVTPRPGHLQLQVFESNSRIRQYTQNIGLDYFWLKEGYSGDPSDKFRGAEFRMEEEGVYIDIYGHIFGKLETFNGMIDDVQRWADTGPDWKQKIDGMGFGIDGEYEPLAICETCRIPDDMHEFTWNGRKNHAQCLHCTAQLPRNWGTYRSVRYVVYDEETDWEDDVDGPVFVCVSCQNEGHGWHPQDHRLGACRVCDVYVEENLMEVVDTVEHGYGVAVCEWCYENLSFCTICDRYVDPENYDSWDEMCFSCAEGQINELIHEWNYMPSLNFYPAKPTDPMHPLYIGIELEVSWPGYSDRHSSARDWLETVQAEWGDLIYVKSDSSIDDGFEVVTHPMEPQWALNHFPFTLFAKAIKMGARARDESCGTHIHINKDSLTTAQMWKMIQLHYRLEHFCGLIGGRGMDTEYASWSNEDPEYSDSIRDRLREIARNKGRGFGEHERYVPVNVRNDHTLELRYMEGDITPESIQKNIEWVQALYDFTREVSVQDIKDGVLDDPGYLVGSIFSKNLPRLQAKITNNVVIPRPLPSKASV